MKRLSGGLFEYLPGACSPGTSPGGGRLGVGQRRGSEIRTLTYGDMTHSTITYLAGGEWSLLLGTLAYTGSETAVAKIKRKNKNEPSTKSDLPLI